MHTLCPIVGPTVKLTQTVLEKVYDIPPDTAMGQFILAGAELMATRARDSQSKQPSIGEILKKALTKYQLKRRDAFRKRKVSEEIQEVFADYQGRVLRVHTPSQVADHIRDDGNFERTARQLSRYPNRIII